MYPVVYGDSTPTRHRSDTRGPCLACLERTVIDDGVPDEDTYWIWIPIVLLAIALPIIAGYLSVQP